MQKNNLTTINIGKIEFAVGLEWYYSSTENKNQADAYIKELFGQQTTKYFSQLQGEEYINIGLTNDNDGIFRRGKKYYSLAVYLSYVLAKQTEFDRKKMTIVSLQFEGRGTYLVSYDEKFAVSTDEGDYFVDNNKVDGVILGLLQSNDMIIYTNNPNLSAVENSQIKEITIDDLLGEINKEYLKKSIIRYADSSVVGVVQRNKRVIILSILLIAVALILWNIYQYIEKKRIEAKRLAEQQRIEQEELMAKASPPWHDIPKAIAMAVNCENAIAKLPVSYGGWRINEISCQYDGDAKINILLIRINKTKTSNITTLALDSDITEWDIAFDGTSASKRLRIPGKIDGDKEQLAKQAEVNRAIIALAQVSEPYLQIQINEVANEVPQLPGINTPNIKSFDSIAFTTTGELSPSLVIPSLVYYQGLRIHDITLKREGERFYWVVNYQQWVE